MKGNYFQNILMLVLVNIIIKPIWIFGIDINVQNRVGEAVFGQYQALLFLSLIFQVVLDLGLQTYNSQKVSQNHNRISYLLPNILLGKLGLMLIYFVLLAVTAWNMKYSGEAFHLILLLGLMQVLNSFLLYFRSSITALQHFKADILLSVLDKALMIVFGGALLYISRNDTFPIQWFVYAQIAAFGISAIISLLIILKNVHFSKFKIQLSYIYPIIKKGIPIAILVLLMSIFMRGDLVVLERLNVAIDPTQAGKYTSAFRLLDAANNFTGILLAAWLLPLFAKNLKSKSYINDLSYASIKILMPIAVGLLLFTYFYGEAIMQLLYKDNYSVGDGDLLFLFMCGFPFYCLTYVYSTLNTANNKIKILTVYAGMAALYSLVSNIVLVPKYGVQAVAINSVIAQAIFAMCNYFYAKKDFSIPVNVTFLLKICLFVIIDCVFLQIAFQFSFGVLPILITNVLFLLLLIFLLKIVEIKDLKQLKND